jgi:signal transduction histidine kinase
MPVSRSDNSPSCFPPERSVANQEPWKNGLASRVAAAEERERDRIARVLHDDLQQVLYSVQMQVHLLGSEAAISGDRLEQLEREVDAAIRITRDLTTDLNPPILKREGLAAAIRWLCNSMQERFHLSVDLDLDIEMETTNRNPAIESALFQIIRELLFNVHKHAGTSEAALRVVGRDGAMLLEVADSGNGMALSGSNSKTSYGLGGIRDRLASLGGRLTVDSAPGEGTRVQLELPLYEAGESGLERQRDA